MRGGRPVPLKKNADEALKKCPTIEKCIVLRRTGSDVNWEDGRDVWYHEAIANASTVCPPEEMNAEDPLFILYTSALRVHPRVCCTLQAATWSTHQ